MPSVSAVPERSVVTRRLATATVSTGSPCWTAGYASAGITAAR
jgi:hypothetical protein